MALLGVFLIFEHLAIIYAFFNQQCLIKSLKICKEKLNDLCTKYKEESFEAEKRATKHFAKLQAIEKLLKNCNDYTSLVYNLKKILANPTIN